MNLANKVLIALGMGLLVGLIINFSGASNLSWVNDYIIKELNRLPYTSQQPQSQSPPQ